MVVALATIAACSGTSCGKGVNVDAECRKLSREIGLDESTPLGFTGRQLVEAASFSTSVTAQIADRTPTGLQIRTSHEGAAVLYTPAATIQIPGVDHARGCLEKMTTPVLLAVTSDDGKVALNQTAMLSARRLDQLTVTQRVAILGDTSAFPGTQPLTGTVDVPPMYVAGMTAAVLDVEIELPGGRGAMIVNGEAVEPGVRHRFPARLLAMWAGR